MARFVVSAVAGIAAGFITGNPVVGFQVFAGVYGLTGFLDPNQQVSGPRIDDLKGTTSEYGTPVSHTYGHPRLAGAIVWCSDKREIATTEEAGGKGGPSTDVTTYTYEIDCRYLLTANEIEGVRRIWSNGKLVWSQADDADGDTIEASGETNSWRRITVYTGSVDQMPDPAEETALGIDNCPAYRGRGSVFIEGLNLGGSGFLPNLTFELGTPTTVGEADVETVYEADLATLGSIQIGTTTYAEGSVILGETTTPPTTLNTSLFTAQDTSPTPVSFELPGTLGPSGVTPQRGTGDDDALIFIHNGTLFASYGGAVPIDLDLDMTGVDDVGYLIDGSSIWITARTDELYRLAKTGGVVASNLSAPTARTLALLNGNLYGADTVGTGQLIEWDADTLVQLDSYELADDAVGMLSTDGTYIYDIAGNSLMRWVAGTDTWETVVADLGQIASFAGISGELANPVIRNDFIYITRIVSNILTTLRARIFSVGLTDAPLPAVLEDLCIRSGMPESYLDFSSCEGQYVRSLAVSQVTPARGVMELLGSAYLQEFVETDALKTVARGGASVETIAYVDMGATAGDPVEPLPLKRLNDVELSAQVSINYINVLNDYQKGTEYSDRLLGAGTGVSATELALGLTPQEAKRIADVRLTDAVASIIQAGPVGLLPEYAHLEPADVVVLTGHDDSTYRARIVKITDDGLLRTLECVLDDATVINSEALTDEDYESTSIVRRLLETTLVLFDSPIFRDADNNAGIHAAVSRPSLEGDWSGAALFRGVNETGWSEVARFTDRTWLGTTTTDLDQWTGGWLSDEASTVTVSGVGELSSTTDDAIINGTAPAYLIGSEVLYARTATLVSEGVYMLSGLYRGRRGTEWSAALGTASGADVVLLQASGAGVRRVGFENGQLGTEYDFRAVTLGASIGSADTESITPMGIGLKPFAPVHVEADDNGDGTYDVTWQRRTRLSCRFTGSLGINTPLGELSESYAVEVFDGASVTSTQTVSDDAATVTASPGDVVRVYQVSAIVGRGYVAELTL